jgi:hypothetical protein
MPSESPMPRWESLIHKVYNRINPDAGAKAPPMAPHTRRFLSELLARENEGISSLIGIDVEEYWPSMRAQEL